MSGDLAYSRGHFTEKHEDPRTLKIVTTSGSYLTVYKKQPDGSWTHFARYDLRRQ